MASKFWHIRRCSLFDHLDPSQWELLERGARLKSFAARECVYLPSDASRNVYFLHEGRIRLSSATPDGKLAILGFIEPGEVFGELALVDTGSRDERAESVTRSTVVMLSGESLADLMEKTASLTIRINRMMGLRRKRVERRLRGMLFRSNRERLTMLLVDLVEQYGIDDPDGIRITIRLSHQDLASLIGATRESVSYLLGDLQAEGIIRYGRQWIVVRDKCRLETETDQPRTNKKLNGCE
ncbi:Crp/Fnr family transcriptional regulator [Rubripirellula tenax]|nr:Crp/Fnr family transcriptional regulator [Rubripirellula tenax]